MSLIQRTQPLLRGQRRRVVTRCADCEPRGGVMKVAAVSVSHAARCDACLRSIGEGERFWAVFAEDQR